MLTFLRSWLASRVGARKHRQAVAIFDAWAGARGHDLRHARRNGRREGGCVVEGRQGRLPWRFEWGPSQRHYVPGTEWRCMAEPEVPRELNVLLLSRSLRESLEREVYQRYVDDLRTRADADVPAEIRWLMLHPSLDDALPPPLRRRLSVVGSDAAWVGQWLAGPLGRHLAGIAQDSLTLPEPWVLTIGRGRLMLRAAMPSPTEADLIALHTVFEHGLREAQRLGQQLAMKAPAEPAAPHLEGAEVVMLDAMPADEASASAALAR